MEREGALRLEKKWSDCTLSSQTSVYVTKGVHRL
jgi:hypothetical protein